MSATDHPVLEDMQKLGCTSPVALAVAFQIYMELSEVRQCWDVQYSFSPELGVIYFKVLDHESQEVPELILPLSAFQEISPAWLNLVVATLASDSVKKVVTLALKDSDSSVLFYKVYDGLEEPPSAEDSEVDKLAHEKKKVMEAELKKQQDHLYEIAKLKNEM